MSWRSATVVGAACVIAWAAFGQSRPACAAESLTYDAVFVKPEELPTGVKLVATYDALAARAASANRELLDELASLRRT